MKKPLRERSPLVYVLVALIPYSKPNLLLSYKPSQFFRELERISRYKQSTLKKAYSRGLKSGLINEEANLPRLTVLGKQRVAPFIATKLGKNAALMVIFDIPEAQSRPRRLLRSWLRYWGFKQVQKSVWVSDYDYREFLIRAVEELGLTGCVEIHESARLYPSV